MRYVHTVHISLQQRSWGVWGSIHTHSKGFPASWLVRSLVVVGARGVRCRNSCHFVLDLEVPAECAEHES